MPRSGTDHRRHPGPGRHSGPVPAPARLEHRPGRHHRGHAWNCPGPDHHRGRAPQHPGPHLPRGRPDSAGRHADHLVPGQETPLVTHATAALPAPAGGHTDRANLAKSGNKYPATPALTLERPAATGARARSAARPRWLTAASSSSRPHFPGCRSPPLVVVGQLPAMPSAPEPRPWLLRCRPTRSSARCRRPSPARRPRRWGCLRTAGISPAAAAMRDHARGRR
jgi:hypothetical protein